MEENQNITPEVGNQNVETTPTPAAEETASVQPEKERTYTKAEVQDLMKRRVERSHKAFFTRYGVDDLKGLDELMHKSKSYSDMESEYGAIQVKNSELTRENAFLRNNINPEKYEDIIAFFKGTGIDFSEEQLLEALKTHPEWLKVTPSVTTIQKMGNEFHKEDLPSERDLASKLLGVKL